jgi:hypothetical protein
MTEVKDLVELAGVSSNRRLALLLVLPIQPAGNDHERGEEKE